MYFHLELIVFKNAILINARKSQDTTFDFDGKTAETALSVIPKVTIYVNDNRLFQLSQYKAILLW